MMGRGAGFFAAAGFLALWGGAVPSKAEAQGAHAYLHETVEPIPIDPGRPWGWAVQTYMQEPGRTLYNTAKAKLMSGQQVFSHTIGSFDIDRYCEEAKHYDFTWFEMQHATLTFGEVEEMVAACPQAGATPMIRMADATEANIQQAMDIGMLGIIIPTVDDALEARQATMFTRFPPVARRSAGAGQASRLWTPVVPEGSSFRNSINDNMLVVVMIETLEGVQNTLEIASVPGIDAVILGNADLSSFAGVPQSDPRYQDLLLRVRNATYLAGKYWGNANSNMASGNPLSADSRFHQNGPSNDGWTRPAPGGR